MSIFTKIGDFVGGILNPVNNILDNIITNKEELLQAKLEIEKELNRHKESVQKLLNEESESARNREIKLNESVHASWLPKNIASLIALVSIFGGIAMLVMIYYGFGKSTETVHTQIVQGILSIITMVLGYYFGSSHNQKQV
jgi:hypothetical protein